MPGPLVYLDASVALRTILDVPNRDRLQAWMQVPGTTFVSSRLLRTDVIRVLRRDGRPLLDGSPLLDRVRLIEISRDTTPSPSPSSGTSGPWPRCTWRRRC